MEIRGEKLNIAYGNYLAVKNMDITLPKGKITSIIGPNGSGKSTVLKGLTRLLNYKSGAVYLNQDHLKNFTTKELAKKIAVLPQMHSVPPDFEVQELVSYGRMPYQKWYERCNEEDQKIVDWAMEVTGVLPLRKKSINQCSGGESQRVWIATVLAQQPKMLFLDEPTTYLDISHQMEMMRLVKRLNRQSGIGVVMVLHDLSHALEVSDWIVVVKEGEKYSEGVPKEVLTPKMMQEVYNVECQIIHIPGREKPLIAYNEI